MIKLSYSRRRLVDLFNFLSCDIGLECRYKILLSHDLLLINPQWPRRKIYGAGIDKKRKADDQSSRKDE